MNLGGGSQLGIFLLVLWLLTGSIDHGKKAIRVRQGRVDWVCMGVGLCVLGWGVLWVNHCGSDFWY